MTLIAAHRGASLTVPDNTGAAFAAAIVAGADVIETDVRADAVGRLVLSHDPVEPVDSPVTLSELLSIADGRIGLDLEIKEREVVADLLATVAGWEGWLLISSFDEGSLADVRAAAPWLTTGLLLEELSGDVIARARDCGADVLLPEAPLLADPQLDDCPLPLWTWTVNAPGALARLLSCGRLAGVITDDPTTARVQRAAAAAAGERLIG